jgi:hypothetical protein
VKRRVWHPGLNRHVVLGGCKLSTHEPAGIRLKDFVHAATAYPTSPASVDYSAKALSVIENIEGNDSLGDCVIAEDAHYIAVVTGNANTLYSYTRDQTVADYSAITGYDPSDPNTDQGTDPIAALNYRVQRGYADGSKDAGWALVDCSNKAEVAYAINTFGNLKLWFGIPGSIANNLPSASGFVWDVSAGAADTQNGHCIGSCAYGVSSILAVAVTAQGVVVMTWGMLGLVTWAALAAWFVTSAGGGAAVRVTTDWVAKATGNTPSGLNLSALTTAFDLYFGGTLVVPPAPTPAPPPTPGTAPTLAEAQGWSQAGISGQGHFLLTRAQAVAAANAGLAAGWPKP